MVSIIEAPKSVEWGGYRWQKAKNNYYSRKDKKQKPPKVLMLHREMCREYYGDLPDDLVVHHIDGNPSNNDQSNLEPLTHSEHRKRHPSVLSPAGLAAMQESCRARYKEYPSDCIQCKAKFTYRAWAPRTVAFCSPKCNDMWRRDVFEPRLANCKKCGEEFTQVRNVHYFCSKTCQQKYNTVPRKVLTTKRIICPACMKRFTTRRSNGKFCSRECACLFHAVVKERKTLRHQT